MADKTSKKKPKKTAKAAADPSVLGTLRSTRPSRIGGERRGAATRSSAKSGGATKSSAAATKSGGATKSSAAATKPGGATKSSGTKQPRAAKSAPAATAAKSSAAHRPDTPRTAPPPPRRDDRPGAVTTAVQAAGELAQIGLMVGGRILKRAARRLPRP
jgi:hypothetical protein